MFYISAKTGFSALGDQDYVTVWPFNIVFKDMMGASSPDEMF